MTSHIGTTIIHCAFRAVGPREVVFEFDSLAMHWQVTSDIAGPARAAAARLSDAELGRLKQALAEALGPYVQSDRVRIPNTALCAACRR